MGLKYLALGDSYTIGEGVARNAIWPAQLAARLQAGGHDVEDPQVVARTGWTTDELLAALSNHTIEPPYDLVTLLIGVNDQYRGRPVSSFLEGLRVLMMRALQYAGGNTSRVCLVSIPDWGVTAFAQGRNRAQIGREIDAYNEAKQLEGEKHGFVWVDVTKASRVAGQQPAMLADDGLHPSGAQYSTWVDQILPTVEEMLTAGR